MAATQNLSPGLWLLAWRRLRADRVAMASLGVVLAFLLLLALSATSLVASDWEREVGVNYAPPVFAGPDAASAATLAARGPLPPNAFDPLAPDIAALGQSGGEPAHDLVKLCIRPSGVAACDRELGRKAPGSPAKEIGQRLTPCRGVHDDVLSKAQGFQQCAGRRQI